MVGIIYFACQKTALDSELIKIEQIDLNSLISTAGIIIALN